MAAGSVLSIEDLVDRYQVSRSVIREVLRVLASMGLIETRRRVGIMIQAAGAWSVFDPQVIRWRLASGGRMAQMRSITELRTAIEPHAAWLAAERIGDDEASELVGLAAKMWAAGKAGDESRFLSLDIDFHRRVLAASGNEMFAKLQLIVAEVLAGRHHYHLMPHYPPRAGAAAPHRRGPGAPAARRRAGQAGHGRHHGAGVRRDAVDVGADGRARRRVTPYGGRVSCHPLPAPKIQGWRSTWTYTRTTPSPD
ncbi:FadR/GntR family transcriptional regulator [Nonomuraea ferruginea]